MNDDDGIHRRFNPLTNSWILCSPHRAKRPWLGQNEQTADIQGLTYDPACYLCPGNQRAAASANGEPLTNPPYDSTFVFPNDFPALKMDNIEIKASGESAKDDLEAAIFRNQRASGICKVICFSPTHNLTLAEMEVDQVVSVIDQWVTLEDEIRVEGSGRIEYMQIFENKGAVMGCSNPHPHGQVWATDYIPEEPQKEFKALMEFRKQHHGACLLCAYVQMELDKKDRVLYSNEHFAVVVPYWATWPFETLVVAQFHAASLKSLTPPQRRSLADALVNLTCTYDNLFETSFPYSMGVHGAPLVAPTEVLDAVHLHLHFYPPLLRSKTVKKFLVGYEMLGEGQRDLTAEMATARLRAVAGVHYKKKGKIAQ